MTTRRLFLKSLSVGGAVGISANHMGALPTRSSSSEYLFRGTSPVSSTSRFLLCGLHLYGQLVDAADDTVASLRQQAGESSRIMGRFGWAPTADGT